MKDRRNKKKIVELIFLKGDKLVKPIDLYKKSYSFYLVIIGTAFPNMVVVNMSIMRNRPTLAYQQKIDFCIVVIDQEIYTDLCSIGDDKDPRANGFNTMFF